MRYENRLKGSVTQALVRAMLTDAGLSVVPLGIEEVVREVAELSIDRYLALELPMRLRKLPDFFVANADRTQSWLVEVKFRRTWNERTREELLDTLTEQAQHWSPLYLVLFWGETPSYYPDQPSSWLKAGKLRWRDEDLWLEAQTGPRLWRECSWTHLDRVQDVFPALNNREVWDAAILNLTIAVSKGLVGLQGDL